MIKGEWGHARVAAVVGPLGSGTSALATSAVRSHRGSVRILELTEPVGADEVRRWFKEGGQQLTGLSGLRWLFRNEPGGFDAIYAFIEGLAASQGAVSWVLTADDSVWDHVCAVTSLDQAVGTVVRLRPLPVDDLAAAVLARHEMSGYDPVFEAGDDWGWKIQHLLLRGENLQQRHQNAWFHTLHEASGGVVHDALRLWQASIRDVDEASGVIRVGSVARPPFARVGGLPEQSLLTLLAIMRQGWTDTELHATLFVQDRTASQAHLQRLLHLGVLERCGDARYQIARHLRSPVQRVLSGKGWLK